MNDASTSMLLAHVVACADAVLHRRGHVTREGFNEVMTQLRRLHERPSETERRTHFALMLMDALGHIVMADAGDAARWRMVAGSIFPCVQDDALLAREDERTQLADTR